MPGIVGPLGFRGITRFLLLCREERGTGHKQTKEQDNFREWWVALPYTAAQNGTPAALQHRKRI